jgi:polyether ionophore transport system permease protein
MTALAGTGSLIRLALRRDRIMLTAWILIFAGMAAGSASATVSLYGTPDERAQAALAINNSPSLVALYGLIYDVSSIGAISMIKLGAFGGALVGVLAILIVNRHTRAEEEAGRLELVGSAVVGRHAPLAAALIVAVTANLVLGILTALGLMSANLPTSGSVAFGFAWAAVGICFAAVAAVAAQITASGRATIGIAVTVVGVAYVFRAIGDTAGDGGAQWVRWLSPIGWGQQVRPFQGDRWWVLLLPLGFFTVLVTTAHVLLAHRDHGAGLVPDRLGPASAARGLSGPFGLAWRLQRGVLFGWAAGFALLGLVFGNVASNVGSFLQSPAAKDFIQKLGGVQGLTDAFMSTELGMAGVIASAYGVAAVMRLRTEESEMRAEPILATAVRRVTWAWSHIAIALFGVAFLLLCMGAGAGLTYSAQTGRSSDFFRVLEAALARIPAAWVIAAIVVLAFGIAPRAAIAGWVALVAFLLLGEFGPLFKLDQWVMDLSPFAHTPRLPGGVFTAVPLAWLAALAVVLMTAGLAGLRRRDIPVT